MVGKLFFPTIGVQILGQTKETDMGLLSRKTKVRTPDGHTITLSVEKAAGKQNSKSIAILTHGIFTDRDEKGRFVRLSQRLQSVGIDVVRFDFRGHGDSPLPSTDFNVSGGVIDYHSVLNWVASEGWPRVGVVGSSFGGGLVLLERLLPLLLPVHGIVLLNPVIDYEATFLKPILKWGKEIFSEKAIQQILEDGRAKVINDFEASLLFLTELSTIRPYQAIPTSKTPLLVFHGDSDEKVPWQPAKQCFTGLSNVTLKVIAGAGHGFKDPQIEDQVHGEAVSWIRETLSKPTE